ncbi:MAG: FkbM family methyltransferase [Pseudomonadota bacterium]|nr:FkbM family methyltransferase [Pseudomonadota bacterium]
MQVLKSSIKGVCRRLGFDIRASKHANTEERAVECLLAAAKATVVLDVGANTGQFVDLVRRVGYDGLVVSFEALQSAHAMLETRASKSANWMIAPRAALGAEQCVLDMNVAGNSVSSSLLKMKGLHLKAAPESAYVGRQSVQVERLDRMATKFLPPDGNVYLKIDTQGYEKQVLKGSAELLPRVAALQLELSIIPLYENSPELTEMITYASALGYELFDLVPGYRDVTSGRVYQLEGFFIRRDMI